MEIEETARQIVDSAVKVHKALGTRLLESAYQACLAYELAQRHINVETEVYQLVHYGELTLDAGYRLDMLVENCIIIENKAVEQILPIHEAQLLTYMKLKPCSLGFLINWNVPLLKNGIRRFVNHHPESIPIANNLASLR